MIPKDILQKINHIDIYTRRLLAGSMVGDSRSAVKGSGLEFDQIREYQMGDDVRFIDWHASARMNKILVKQYIEERNRTVFLAVDVSGSSAFSSHDQLRREMMAQIASVLALVADYGKDHVGLLLFSDKIELSMPIKPGRNHVHGIMEQLFCFKPNGTTTDLNIPFKYAAHLKRKDTIFFVISDFIGNSFDYFLGTSAKRHDVVAIRCLDTNERQVPTIGFLELKDSETGIVSCIDTRRKGASLINQFLEKRKTDQDGMFARYGIDRIDIESGKPFIGDLIRFFRRRMRY